MVISEKFYNEYLLVANELFKKDFLNIGIGSISLKLKADKMLINKKNRIISENDFTLLVNILRENMQWEEATDDIKIHSEIYKTYSNIKAIVNIFPKNVMSYAQKYNTTEFIPTDFMGKNTLGKIPIISIKNSQEWEETSEFIISKALKESNIVIIRGFGVFIKSRDIREILKLAIILENSAYILLNS
ncbi:hypothetical protein FE773_06590 [Caminibacter mediatlanticus TB-2]|uniref:Class II aldolase/adducin N-terminal domain-containing protein n=1 Tax=Caminibacter mediatlanticus TB-2 TaxID=391592 RepID=A0AAI9F2V8_9BACT|nr:class II aldolase/adducin family protein [Caminibacter mediatlanticus]EDM24214.1 hypothetical protein CMTB2_01823 [Caminibacter mediatlanticus TB-2]QCT94862.1 hypothetical protein FE773_06590 [Caminibacter mediatlanticus TB-2]